MGSRASALSVLILTVCTSAAAAPLEGIAISPFNDGLYHDGWIDFNKNGRRDVYEAPSASIDARIDDLLSQMNVEEKTCQLVTLYGYGRVLKDELPTPDWKQQVWKDGVANIDEQLNGIPRYQGNPDSQYVWPPSKHVRALNEIQRWFVEETRLGIPVDFTNEGIRGVCYGKATNFPSQIGIGATWDKALVAEIGRVTGLEAKAVGYTNIYSPIMDLARDPRWGRVPETYGEDPYQAGRLAVEQARALRKAGVASTAKHFAVYGVPKGGRDGNARTDPHVAPREMQMMYLRPFAELVAEAGILGVMSSYNDYDGVPVSGSKMMLMDELRGRMGFRGYVVSDSDAVRYLWTKHRVAPTHTDAIRLFLESGGNVRTEFNPPENFVLPLRDLLKTGRISMKTIDDRVRDVLRVKFTLGLFDAPYVADPEGADALVHCEEHRQLALRAARESMVLLKNDGKLLPLSKDVGSILVCGPNAASIDHSIGRYGPTAGEVITVLDAIRQSVGPSTTVRYAEGCKIADDRWPESEIFYEPPSGDDARMIEEAVGLARQSEVIVAVVGESPRTVGESKSRTDLNLTGYQNDLVRALHGTGKPVVVVLINGRPLTINWIDRYVPSIVEAWFPGEWCGRAVADVLFGDYNPGGKLSVTFPRTVGQLELNFPFKPASQAAQEGPDNPPRGIGVTDIVGPLYPFGHGLSYTSFVYSELEIEPTDIEPGDSVRISCRVTNSGQGAGDEVVQLYVRDDYSSVITYDSVLRGFERVPLGPGKSRKLTFELRPADLELLDTNMQPVVEPGSFTVMVGSSSTDIRLQGTFQVSPAEQIAGNRER